MDRNIIYLLTASAFLIVALRKESVDRNSFLFLSGLLLLVSLSARRAWIEIGPQAIYPSIIPSLSARRAWIEMFSVHEVFANFEGSLSARRAWIEILST